MEVPSLETSTTDSLSIEAPASTPGGYGDYCVFKDKKFAFNERIEDGCERICTCMASSATVECEPRCPKKNHTTATHEQCVTVPDPKDLCCHIELCDVTLDDHEQGAIAIVPAPPSLIDAMKHRKNQPSNRTFSISKDPSLNLNTGNGHDSNDHHGCEYNGNKYTIGANNVPNQVFAKIVHVFLKLQLINPFQYLGMQFNEGCESLCICTAEGIVHCEKIECPSTFGLEIMDPHCLEWAPEPATFRAIVPKCCPGWFLRTTLISYEFYVVLY